MLHKAAPKQTKESHSHSHSPDRHQHLQVRRQQPVNQKATKRPP